MNENNEHNNSRVTPYKATANLNTAIGNPSVNINDTMNVNIQTMATNIKPAGTPVQSSSVETPVYNQPSINNQPQVSTNNTVAINQNTVPVVNTNVSNNISQPSTSNNTVSGIQSQVTPNNNYVTKTYVTTNNKPKKKSITFNVNSEFKIAILIIVILLVFVFLLPVISDLLGGY